MTAVLRYEWRRIVSTRATLIVLGLMLLLPACVTVLGLNFSRPGEPGDNLASALGAPEVFGGILASVLGAQAIGQEYRFGTIRSTLTLFPRRPPVMVAKLLVAGLLVLAAGLLATGLVLGITAAAGWSLGYPQGPGGGGAGLLLRTQLVLLGWLVFGFALAALTRQTTLGIVLPLVMRLVVELALIGLLKEDWLMDVLPFWNSDIAVRIDVEAWGGLGVFWLWAAVLGGLSYLSFTLRDA